MTYFKKRSVLKTAKDVLRQCRHFRNMREDLLSSEVISKLDSAEQELTDALKTKDIETTCGATGALHDLLDAAHQGHSRSSVAENVEILIVAFVAAMGIKAYFLQPFKIPTGSMQPTLYGITAEAGTQPDVFDKMPLKLGKWFFTGKWYREEKVAKDGHLGDAYGKPNDPANYYHMIGGNEYRIPKGYGVPYEVGSMVKAGSVLWSGHINAGDHLFVNRMAWNFRHPRRSEIMVFSTRGVEGIRRQDTFYIKRLVGLGGEELAIGPPHVFIDGKPMMSEAGIRRVTLGDGYAGYANAGRLFDPSISFRIPEGHYFAMGDNTLSSEDSRYWGAVPRKNMVGPSLCVYWPFTKRWDLHGADGAV